ncbi:ABC transporter substrate-binding protein [Marinibacterium sp. SX1]|uniref:ABC transporter substrate-binding protein n=1 Tax=Marinibacterium sp. SX1 TaxID=3388424 RepID=UPI003D175951
MVTRRHLLAGGAAALALPSVLRARGVETQDVLGRPVVLDDRPQRIVLLDAPDVIAMSALLPDPLARVVGWAGAPRLDFGPPSPLKPADMPEVGKLSPDTLSAEAILGLAPDLVVASAYMLPPGVPSPLMDHLAAAGIPVAWTSGHDAALPPETSLSLSMAFWGAVLGQEARAAEIAGFGLSRFAAVRACAEGPRPRCYMEIMSTYDECCWAAGQAFWGPLIDMAGGTLLAGGDGWGGQLSPESLAALQPQVYVATGGSHAPQLQPAIGPGLDPVQGRAGLARLAARPALRETPAVRSGRVHGIWSGLITSPLLVPILAECLGTWLRPGPCAELSPQATLDRLNTYLSHPLNGPLWLSPDED